MPLKGRSRTDYHRAYMKGRYNNDPEHRVKHKARTATLKAVVSGRIKKGPCERCGVPETEAHHDDYSKPLSVRWLCRPCHLALHREEVPRA